MSKTNESLMQRRNAAVARGVSQIHPLVVQRAENATVWDVEGRQYIDFAGGIAVLNTGHRHPKIMDAVKRQMEQFTHTCFQVLAYEPYIELCEKLNELVPGDFVKKTLLVTTGSEALENAVKIARAATGRAGVIAFTGAYHGRTMMTLSMTGKVAPYSAGMGLMPGGVYRALFPCPLHGVSDDDAIASIERIFKNDAQPQDIAAIVIEPVQGEGGVNPATTDYFAGVRRLCDERGILFMVDEVQTGLARTGRWFGFQHFGVSPDVVSMAKALGNGVPIGACWAKADVAASFSPGDHATTYGGQPFATAAARAVLETMEAIDAPALAARAGEKITEAMMALPQVSGVRGLGMLLAIELEGVNAQEVAADCLAAGLVVNGVTPTALRLAPPLIVEDAHIAEAVALLQGVLDASGDGA